MALNNNAFERTWYRAKRQSCFRATNFQLLELLRLFLFDNPHSSNLIFKFSFFELCGSDDIFIAQRLIALKFNLCCCSCARAD